MENPSTQCCRIEIIRCAQQQDSPTEQKPLFERQGKAEVRAEKPICFPCFFVSDGAGPLCKRLGKKLE